MTANPARPVARYRPGKAIAGHDSSDEDEQDAEEQPQQQAPRRPLPHKSATRPQPVPRQQEPDEEDDEEGFVTDEEDGDVDVDGGVSLGQTTAEDVSSKTTTRLLSPKQETESSEEDSEGEEEEDEESSEEESSSEEEPQRKFQRPTFIRKTDRKPSSPTPASEHNVDTTNTTNEPDIIAVDDENARRLAVTESLIADRIHRDNLARAAGKKSWDDDDEVAPEDMVDDTDGLDPEAEYQAWKLRELKRLKRDREKIEADERERDERERRRNLTEEERRREDEAYINHQKAEKDAGRGEADFLKRYHHGGAFFQDEEAAAELRRRNVMGAVFVDDVDKQNLPQFMQIRDMTKLGKKGRTRYTDLRGEDTGDFGRDVKGWRPGDRAERDHGRGGIGRGVDERFLPDRDGAGGGGAPTVSGANASVLGVKRERRRSRSRSRSRSPMRRQTKGDAKRDASRSRRRSYSRSVSRSRSRSPPPRRKRSPSPYQDQDKRRRVDAV